MTTGAPNTCDEKGLRIRLANDLVSPRTDSDMIRGPTSVRGSALLTAADLAERWRVARDSIYRIHRSQLPFVRLGRRTRRYLVEDVIAYEQARRVG